MDSLIAVHRYLVEVLLFIMIFNIIILLILKDNLIKAVLLGRIGFFGFWMAWTMVVFSGLIVYIFMKQPYNLPVNSMIVASIILPIIDGYRAVKLRKIWSSHRIGLAFNTTMILIELAIVAGIIILTIKS